MLLVFLFLGMDEPPDETQENMKIRNDINKISVYTKHENQARKERVLVLLECSRICPFKHRGSLYICIYCNKEYKDPTKLREHNVEHENMEPVEIKRIITRMNTAELIKADITDISCKLCDTPIDRFDDLIKHLINNHDKKIDPKLDNGILPFKISFHDYNCAICDEKYTDYKTLNHHMNIHYPRFVCEHCGSGFVTALRLKSHGVSHETGSFPCNACVKVFSSEHGLKGHYEYAHKKVRRHICPHCPETFLVYHDKSKHMASVHGFNRTQNAVKHKCNFCMKMFIARGPLSRHMRETHMKERRYSCDVCDVKFYGKSQIKKHMRVHFAEKEYQCGICQKKYRHKKHLDAHNKTHSEQVSCEVCDATFIGKIYLKKHKLSMHTSERFFNCGICQKTYGRNSHLTRHMKTHLK